MREVVLLLPPAWVAVALVSVGVQLRGASVVWARAVAVLLVATAGAVLAFLGADDHYTQDGRSNWDAYDVELVALPSALGLLLGAGWLLRQAGTSAAGFATPLLALGAGAAALGCVLFTTN